MRVLPTWAKKPKHKKTVIATPKGWVVESTGEVLVSHFGLDEKLKSLYKEVMQMVEETPVADEKDEEPTTEKVDEVNDQTEQEPDQGKEEEAEDKKVEVEEEPAKPKKKRRGRPPKKKDATNNSSN